MCNSVQVIINSILIPKQGTTDFDNGKYNGANMKRAHERWDKNSVNYFVNWSTVMYVWTLSGDWPKDMFSMNSMPYHYAITFNTWFQDSFCTSSRL